MITILGKEFDFSFTDADNIKKWAEAQEKVREKHNDLARYQSTAKEYNLKEYSEIIRACCYAIADLFDEMLGDGAAIQIFGQKSDFEKCIDAYQEFEEEFVKQSQRIQEKVNKYKPVGRKKK